MYFNNLMNVVVGVVWLYLVSIWISGSALFEVSQKKVRMKCSKIKEISSILWGVHTIFIQGLSLFSYGLFRSRYRRSGQADLNFRWHFPYDEVTAIRSICERCLQHLCVLGYFGIWLWQKVNLTNSDVWSVSSLGDLELWEKVKGFHWQLDVMYILQYMCT